MPPRTHKARNQEMIYKEYGNVPGRLSYKLVEAASDPVIPGSHPERDNMDHGTSTIVVEEPVNPEGLPDTMDSIKDDDGPKRDRRGKV